MYVTPGERLNFKPMILSSKSLGTKWPEQLRTEWRSLYYFSNREQGMRRLTIKRVVHEQFVTYPRHFTLGNGKEKTQVEVSYFKLEHKLSLNVENNCNFTKFFQADNLWNILEISKNGQSKGKQCILKFLFSNIVAGSMKRFLSLNSTDFKHF